LAAETSNSEFVIIQEGDVFPDDLYAGAIRVVVDGTLDGDLIAFAAEEIVINGTVTGSVTAVSPKVTIAGQVNGSLRVTGNDLRVAGDVGGDVVAAVVSAHLAPSSRVEGDVLLWAWDATALGSIGMDLMGTQRNLALAGSIEGDVDVSVRTLTVVDSLTVTGDLGYRSQTEAVGLEMAEVGGAVVEKDVLPANLRVRAIGLLGRILITIVLSVAALSAAYGWPRRTERAIAEAGRRPVGKWLRGAVVLFSPLIAAAVTGLILGLAPAAVAFPLLAVLVPVILALAGVALALAVVAGAPVAGWVGGVVFKRLDRYGAILAGSLMIGVIWWVPIVGWLVPLLVLPWGLGAWMSSWRAQSSEESSLEPLERSANS
ncbi:MAG TPA: polymer-forming cytoskeletal protein, partial [Acidimicrobiia bacterium]|nr:polymer-forming cytoskeletal protein [Acidimicrobiia bacterium]